MEETQRFVFKSGVGAEQGLGSDGGRNGGGGKKSLKNIL